MGSGVGSGSIIGVGSGLFKTSFTVIVIDCLSVKEPRVTTISNTYDFAPCESVGVHVNIPLFELIFAPIGGFLSRLKIRPCNELSVTLTANDKDFPSSIDNLPNGFSLRVVTGVAVTSLDAVLVPAEFIA